MSPRCPHCNAFVRVTHRGARASENPWVGWEPVVRGECHRHGEVEPIGWDWESIFGDWDPDDELVDASGGDPQ